MEQTDLPNECEFCGHDILLTVILAHPSETLVAYAERERYVVCANCHIGLVALSLAPWQFLRAKQIGGDVNRYYLHDDFYDRDTGEALQPKMEGLTRVMPYSWGKPPKIAEVDDEPN